MAVNKYCTTLIAAGLPPTSWIPEQTVVATSSYLQLPSFHTWLVYSVTEIPFCKVCEVLCGWVYSCSVYQLMHQPINCFKRFENRCFGHYTVALISENAGNATINKLRF